MAKITVSVPDNTITIDGVPIVCELPYLDNVRILQFSDREHCHAEYVDGTSNDSDFALMYDEAIKRYDAASQK